MARRASIHQFRSPVHNKPTKQTRAKQRKKIFNIATVRRGTKRSNDPYKFTFGILSCGLGWNRLQGVCITLKSWSRCGSVHCWPVIIPAQVSSTKWPDKLEISFQQTSSFPTLSSLQHFVFTAWDGEKFQLLEVPRFNRLIFEKSKEEDEYLYRILSGLSWPRHDC